MKRCSSCARLLPLTDFTKDAKRKDGLDLSCRECGRERNRAYRVKNKAKEKARKARDYAANPGKFLARNRRWREANRERERATNKAYYESHKALFLLVGHAYRARLGGVQSIPFTVEQLSQRWAMFGNKCWMKCGAEATCTDHVKPVSKGGANMLCNLRPACAKCNSSKGAQWPYLLTTRVEIAA